MATWVADNAEGLEDLGTSVAQAKLDTKVRADFELQGFIRDWILVVRPIQKMVAEHAEVLVDNGTITEEECANWINLHWEFITSNVSEVSAGCCMVCHGQQHQTLMVAAVNRSSAVGYERIRIKAETFIRESDAAEIEEAEEEMQAISDFFLAGSSRTGGRRTRGMQDEVELPQASFYEYPGFGGEFDDRAGARGEETDGVDDDSGEDDEHWETVESDPETYERVMEAWGLLKEQKQADMLAMAENASETLNEENQRENERIAKLREEEKREFLSKRETRIERIRPGGVVALWHKRVDAMGKKLHSDDAKNNGDKDPKEYFEAKIQAEHQNAVGPKGIVWGKVHPAIRAIIMDLNKGGKPSDVSKQKILPHVKNNDVNGLRQAMSDRKFWLDKNATQEKDALTGNAPDKDALDRFKKRVDFLNQVVRAEGTMPARAAPIKR